jgi:carbon-monoxide dehydrogenase medium subunit
MKPAPFDYFRPSSIAEALSLLSSLDDAKVLAGGQSLMPMLNMRFVQPDHVVDVSRLNMRYIRVQDDIICIGAGTRQRELEFSSDIRACVPILIEALRQVGHVQTRNRGTIGGSLCHLDPSAEIPTICMTLDAQIVVQSAERGIRTIPMREFPSSYMMPAIEPDELVTEIRLPLWPEGHGFAFEEFARRHGDFAIASAAVMLNVSGGVIDRAAVTIGGLSTAPTRIADAEALLIGRNIRQLPLQDAAAQCAKLDATTDGQASAEYRRHLAGVLASRALQRAVARATEGSRGE